MGSISQYAKCLLFPLILNLRLVILLHNLSPNPSVLYDCSPRSFLWVVFVLLAQALTVVRMGFGFTVIFLWESRVEICI